MLSTHKILVVEDNLATLELLKEILEHNNYQVITEMDGLKGLKTVEHTKIDLVLLDVMLPTLNGFEVCERIRKNPDYHTIPIIILTVLTEPQHRIRALQAGATDFMNKPFNHAELINKIKSLLDLKDEISQREHFQDISFCLLTALGSRSPRILSHCRRVAKLSEQLAFRMSLPPSTISKIVTGALLHDVGKLGLDIPLDVNDEERDYTELQELQNHTHLGDSMFSHFNRPIIRSIIRFHHDWSDDIPQDCPDSEIGLPIRIVAICNEFDNLTKGNYEDPLIIENALDTLRNKMFIDCSDDNILKEFQKLIKIYKNDFFKNA